MLAIVSHQFGSQQQQLRHRENLLKMSRTDPLTGLFNRQALLARLEQELLLYRQRSGSYQCALAYIDLDNFKIVNDLLGHDIGDKVINAFSALLIQVMRGVDIVARWGGDEFVVVFPNVNQAQAKIIAGRILTTLEKQQFFRPLLSQWTENQAVIADLPNLTCLIGITDCSCVTCDRLNEEWLLKQADKALYQAKQQGKSRVNICTNSISAV